jgi:hypothetical protein
MGIQEKNVRPLVSLSVMELLKVVGLGWAMPKFNPIRPQKKGLT